MTTWYRPEAFAKEEEGDSLQQPPSQAQEEQNEGNGGGKADGRITGDEDEAAVAGEEDTSGSEGEYESEEDDFSDLPVNTNRLAKMHMYQDSDEEDSDEEDG